MTAPGSRMRQIGWAVTLGLCLFALLALTFKVNAVKSEVRLTERRIIAAERAKLMLETEFQTRASQQQLAAWNAVEFGYAAPRADQYLEHERQLASLGSPSRPGAPAPIRVVAYDGELAAADTAEMTVRTPMGAGGADGERVAFYRGRDGANATDAFARRISSPAFAVTEIGQ